MSGLTNFFQSFEILWYRSNQFNLRFYLNQHCHYKKVNYIWKYFINKLYLTINNCFLFIFIEVGTRLFYNTVNALQRTTIDRVVNNATSSWWPVSAGNCVIRSGPINDPACTWSALASNTSNLQHMLCQYSICIYNKYQYIFEEKSIDFVNMRKVYNFITIFAKIILIGEKVI